MKKGLKKLAKGKVAATRTRLGKPVGGYHIFARRRCRQLQGSGSEKIRRVAQEWREGNVDCGEVGLCEHEAAKERFNASLDRGDTARRRNAHDAVTPWQMGDAEFPVRQDVLQAYIDWVGRHQGEADFQKKYGKVLDAKSIAGDADVQSALKLERKKWFKDAQACCVEQHLGICRVRDDDIFFDVFQASKGISALLHKLGTELSESKDAEHPSCSSTLGNLYGCLCLCSA